MEGGGGIDEKEGMVSVPKESPLGKLLIIDNTVTGGSPAQPSEVPVTGKKQLEIKDVVNAVKPSGSPEKKGSYTR